MEDTSEELSFDAYEYARDVIGGRWSEAEIIIMENPLSACLYARDIIKGRWYEAEPFIMKDPEWAYNYANNVIRGRFIEAEPFILKDIQYAYFYAMMIKERWYEVEPVFKTIPEFAHNYARDVLKNRWIEAESYIIKDIVSAYYYACEVMDERWVDLETKLFDKEYNEIAKWYCERFMSNYSKLTPLWLKYHTNEKYILNYFK